MKDEEKHFLLRISLDFLFILLILIIVSVPFTYSQEYMGVKRTKQLAKMFPTKIPTIPQTNVYKNWETYTNSQYGFSFQYPKDWAISLLDTDSYLFGIETTPLINNDAPVWALSIYLSEKSYEAETANINSGQKVIIGNLTGLQTPYIISPSGATGRTFIASHKNGTFIIHSQKQYETQVEEIIKTLNIY